MNQRAPPPVEPGYSLAIRHEIQRFESVHPSIYAIYDLIELLPDPHLAAQIREHVVCIEDSFVNSQEWTLSRGVPELRLGIVGSLSSGKSALVHRYLTGSYMQEESPEGGRFKKEVVLEGGISFLLLIRDEGGPPALQFTAWVDAVIFVFSLENESSFSAVYSNYAKMAQYRNLSEVPVILVGTQDNISENNPRVIDDSRARKLASDLKRCSYYETCATYGLNVERVFQDACQRILQQRGLVPPHIHPPPPPPVPPPPLPAPPASSSRPATPLPPPPPPPAPFNGVSVTLPRGAVASTAAPPPITLGEPRKAEPRELPTPSSTPTTSRKSRRRSNLFAPSKKVEERVRNGEVGSGRAIPLKQGHLYKKSSKALNKEWKKKYVTLSDDGRLTYHPSLHDYMDDVHGKDIPLQYVTVKVPGQKPRGSKSVPPGNGLAEGVSSLSLAGFQTKDKRVDKVLLTAFESLREPVIRAAGIGDDAISNASLVNGADGRTIETTPNVKKRHRRMKSSGARNAECEDSDGYEFFIVSLDSKQWHFEASNSEERDEWVAAIEQQILNSLQGNESSKSKTHFNSLVDAETLRAVRSTIPGNGYCCDCDAINPDWASINLGIVICIECSGIHRNLGSHISRVRSLELDEWPSGHISVMVAMGNLAANTIWEAQAGCKPTPHSSREEKERWAKAKYVNKEFLAPPPSSMPLHQSLVDAVCRSDVQTVVLVLAHASVEDVNRPIGPRDLRTPLHLACAKGSLAVAQLLLWHRADPMVVDGEGRTPLHWAHMSGATEVIELLGAAGCSLEATSGGGTLPRRRERAGITGVDAV